MQELTRQQNKVVELLAEGYSTEQIAEHLCISKKTAKHHIYLLLQRLGLKNRIEVVALFYKRKIEKLEAELKNQNNTKEGDNLCTAKYAEEEMQRGTI